MRKWIPIIALAIGTLTACTYKTNQEEILGSWKASSLKVNGVETLDSLPSTTNYRMEFVSDVVTITNDADTINYNYTVSELQLIFAGGPVQYYTLDTLREDRLAFHGVQDTVLYRQVFVRE